MTTPDSSPPQGGALAGPARAAALKAWQETRDIACRIRDAGPTTGFAVATVVSIEGSAYRGPGAKLLVESSGDMRGGVSGGCLEADIREVGLDALREGRSCTRRYETGADADIVWGLGLGCEGRVELSILPVTESNRAVWAAIASALDGDTPFVIAFVVDGPAAGTTMVFDARGAQVGSTGDAARDRAIAARASSLVPTGASSFGSVAGARIFLDVMTPPPWLTVFGAGDDARPLVRMAADLGFRTAVVDHRTAYVTADRFPEAHRLVARPADGGIADLPLTADSAAVVMTHSLTHDIGWVRAIAATPIMYLGLLGPQRRVARILAAAEVPAGGRVYGPVGLDLGAVGPEQIALSILAEVLAVRAARDAASLRERTAAIHA